MSLKTEPEKASKVIRIYLLAPIRPRKVARIAI